MNSKLIPTISVEKMKEVDRLMVEEFGISIIIMMENASRNTAALSRKMLDGSVKDKTIVVLSGKGNNGGDGLGAARHLINWGATVNCILATPVSELRKNAGIQYSILTSIDAPIYDVQHTSPSKLKHLINSADLIVDALIGYNLDGDPREPYATLIILANDSKNPILAVDIPSGLNGNGHELNTPTIRAKTTLTLALPKKGLMKKESKEYVGDLYVADLSVPNKVYEKIGIQVPVLFEKDEVVRVENL